MNVLIVFDDAVEGMARVAREVCIGAQSAGAETHYKDLAEASTEDLRWADGVCFGSLGVPGNLVLLPEELNGKVGCCFDRLVVSPLSMVLTLFGLGYVILGLPTSPDDVVNRARSLGYRVAITAGKLSNALIEDPDFIEDLSDAG